MVLLSIVLSASCSKESVPPSSTPAGALTANSALDNIVPRPFDRQILAVGGQYTLNEFIRSDVRSRMDEEPVGDSDNSFDPATIDPVVTVEQPPQADGGETVVEEAQPQNVDEDILTYGQTPDAKFHWAKKSYGDAVKASPTSRGVLVLYADENLYDINRLMTLIEEGRSRIAEKSELPIDRMQVVFGGYRGVPQIEYWVVAEGAPMPEFKAEDRNKASEPEN
jgi:hypothetical protein